MSFTGFDMYRFEGKRIAELWQSYDGLELLEQLGLLSLDGLRHVPELVRSQFAPWARARISLRRGFDLAERDARCSGRPRRAERGERTRGAIDTNPGPP